MRREHARGWGVIVSLLIGMAGCSVAPIGVHRVSPEEAIAELSINVLSAGRPSDATWIVLRRHALVDRFREDPDLAMGALHDSIQSDADPNDELFALAELSFLHARKTQSIHHYLSAAVYAYSVIVPEERGAGLSRLDPRLRVACDLYEVALSEALESPDGDTIELRSARYELPFGSLDVALEPGAALWGGHELVDLVPTTALSIEGLQNRYRRPGIGVPVAARIQGVGDVDVMNRFISPRIRVPATVLLTLESPRRQLTTRALNARLQVFTSDDPGVFETVDAQTLPLAFERSAALAMSLDEARFWRREIGGLRGLFSESRRAIALMTREPHRPGTIPVVFVHGTASSNGRWGDLINDLDADSEMRRRFQFWFFSYDSGNPIAYSAMLLRRALRDLVTTLDPSGDDDCLRSMVVIGHSQGGLLAKMTVVDSQDRFWANLSRDPFEQARLRPATRDLLREGLFVKPLEFVDRVVFISTPHRGSFLASRDLLRRLAARLIRMPKEVVDLSGELAGLGRSGPRELALERIPTSIDNMSPRNPFIRTLAELSIAPGVAAHSIIAVDGEGPLAFQDDGVVEYRSAHVDDVESELVVRSGHSSQSNASTVAEVARILRRHRDLGCRVR